MVHYKLKKRLIGLIGPAGVGKTSLATALVTRQPNQWVQLGFADALKNICAAVFDIDVKLFHSLEEKERIRSPIVIDDYINDLRKITRLDIPKLGLVAMSYRQLLQIIGTDYVRSCQDDFWISSVIREYDRKNKSIVIHDVRFQNEIDAIKKAGGFVIALSRPGVEYAGNHASAQDMSSYADFVLACPNKKEWVASWAHLFVQNMPAWRYYEKSKIDKFLNMYFNGATFVQISKEVFGKNSSCNNYLHGVAADFGVRDRKPIYKYPHTYYNETLGKTCCTCKTWKPLLDFSKMKNAADLLNYQCRPCSVMSAQKSVLSRKSDLLAFLHKEYKKTSKLREIPFDLTVDDIQESWDLQKGLCFYSGTSLTPDGEGLVTLDRLDSNLGYTKDNVRLVTYRVNVAKNTLSHNDFLNLVKKINDFTQS